MGKCNHGDACNFSHDGPGGPSERGGYYKGVAQAMQNKGIGGVVVNPLMQQVQANKSRGVIDLRCLGGASFGEDGSSIGEEGDVFSSTGDFGAVVGSTAQSICK